MLDALAKLLKATRSFVMSVHLSVRMKQLCSHWTYFHEILYLRIFQKSVDKITVPLQSVTLNDTLSAVQYIFFIISVHFLLEL